MVGRRTKWMLAVLVLAPLPLAYRLSEDFLKAPETEAASHDKRPRHDPLTADGMVLLPGGQFLMGSPRPAPEDQRPVHRVILESFWLDRTPVTNRQFKDFVKATAYETTAEKRGTSLSFDRTRGSWEQTPGICWRHPTGPDSSLVAKESYPVVHVSWRDAQAYAAWAGKRLPSEAEYEYAARGGLSDTLYPWGRELTPGHQPQANYWQGSFPLTNLLLDGHYEGGPTAQFAPNAFGLYDMAGNVACWCTDWYAEDAYGHAASRYGKGPIEGFERVLRGGSWLSSGKRGDGLMVADRSHADPNETSSAIGFRCARSVESRR